VNEEAPCRDGLIFGLANRETVPLRLKNVDSAAGFWRFFVSMSPNAPCLPPNPHRPRAFGGKSAEGMRVALVEVARLQEEQSRRAQEEARVTAEQERAWPEARERRRSEEEAARSEEGDSPAHRRDPERPGTSRPAGGARPRKGKPVLVAAFCLLALVLAGTAVCWSGEPTAGAGRSDRSDESAAEEAAGRSVVPPEVDSAGSTTAPRLPPESGSQEKETAGNRNEHPGIPTFEEPEVKHPAEVRRFEINGVPLLVIAEMNRSVEEENTITRFRVVFGGHTEEFPEITETALYRFAEPVTRDFDRDGKPDVLLMFQGGGYGSGGWLHYLAGSSARTKAYLYKSSYSTNGWDSHEVSFENPEDEAVILAKAFPDYSDIQPVDMDRDFTGGPGQYTFLFTLQWAGDGFSFDPLSGFYKANAGAARRHLQGMAAETDSPYKKSQWLRLAEEFDAAAAGRALRWETVNALVSNWQLMRSFSPQGGAAALQGRIPGEPRVGQWLVVERVVEEEGGWIIHWRKTLRKEGSAFILEGMKERVNGKEPTSGEKQAASVASMVFKDGKLIGERRETNFRGEVIRSSVELHVDPDGMSFWGEDRVESRKVSSLVGWFQQ